MLGTSLLPAFSLPRSGCELELSNQRTLNLATVFPRAKNKQGLGGPPDPCVTQPPPPPKEAFQEQG